MNDRLSAASEVSHPGFPAGRREYSTLNGMRGVAAIAVTLFHAVALVGPLFPRGYLAVDLFFVLSGFVIGHAYANRLVSTLSVRDFALGASCGSGRCTSPVSASGWCASYY